MLTKEIQIKTQKELDELFDNAQKIEKEILKNCEEFDEEIAKVLSFIISTYHVGKEFQFLEEFFLEGWSSMSYIGSKLRFLEEAKIIKKYILEEHRPNFNALMRTLINNIENELIINYMED